jgi:PAS domain S-box-containing protein
VSEDGPTGDQPATIFQQGVDMVAIATDGRLVQVSPAWTKALGWSETELTETSVLDFVHPDDLDATEVVFAQVREGATLAAFANRILHKDGSYRTI